MVTVEELISAIRAECSDCAGGSEKEVVNCTLQDKCKLWPYRCGPLDRRTRNYRRKLSSRAK